MEISQGKVREKSGNFDIMCEWQPCKGNLCVSMCVMGLVKIRFNRIL